MANDLILELEGYTTSLGVLNAPASVTIAANFHPGHWLGVGPNVTSSSLNTYLNAHPGVFKGVRKWYYWNEMESATPGSYDFSEFSADFTVCKAHGLAMILVVSLAASYDKVVPAYMLNDAAYGPNTYLSQDGTGVHGAYSTTVNNTFYPQFWVSNVYNALVALETAIASTFGSDPMFEGIGHGETSWQTPPSISGGAAGFLQFWHNLTTATKAALPASKFIGVEPNYASFDRAAFCDWCGQNGIALGGPDTATNYVTTNNSLATVVWPKFLSNHNLTRIAPQVQGPDWDLTVKAPGDVSKAETILKLALSNINPHYLIWWLGLGVSGLGPTDEADAYAAIAAHGQLPAAAAFYASNP